MQNFAVFYVFSLPVYPSYARIRLECWPAHIGPRCQAYVPRYARATHTLSAYRLSDFYRTVRVANRLELRSVTCDNAISPCLVNRAAAGQWHLVWAVVINWL